MLMTPVEAYIYIYDLLSETLKAAQLCWNGNDKKELQILIGELSYSEPDTHTNTIGTGDPAAWYDWIKAVSKITPNEQITQEEAKKAIIELMMEYNKQGFSLSKTIDCIKEQPVL